MKFTFKTKQDKEVTIVAPDEYVKAKNKEGYSVRSALYLYAIENDYVSIDDIDASNIVKVKEEGTKKKTRSRKMNPVKTAIIMSIYEYLLSGQVSDAMTDGSEIDNIEIKNVERIVSFTVGSDTYELTLSKKRKK